MKTKSTPKHQKHEYITIITITIIIILAFNNSNISSSPINIGQTKIIYWHLIIAINYLRVIRRYISFGKSISNFIAILSYSPTTVITFHLCAGIVNAVRVQGS